MLHQQSLEHAIELIENCHFAEAEEVYLNLLINDPDNKIVKFLHSQVKGALLAEREGGFSEKKILNSFKTQKSHYFSVPEFNLNWALNDPSQFSDFLKGNPIVVFDIGARGGVLGEIESLKKYIDYYGFDADEDECNRLNASLNVDFNKFSMLPFFVGKEGESEEFNIYNNPGESSKFSPSSKFVRDYNSGLGIRNTINVESVSLDKIVKDLGIRCIDFIKLDTQGSELEILKSSKSSLNKMLMVESEVEITEMYEGQPLIGEFINSMHEEGLEVLYINRVFQTLQHYNGPARGRITFCDILFARRDEFYVNFSSEDLAKHVLLLMNYGHLDIAHSIWSGYQAVKELLPSIGGYFKSYDSLEKRLADMNADKLLCWQLHRRKSNQFPFDSDRSWPIR